MGEEVYDLANDRGETRNLQSGAIEEVREFEVEAKEKLGESGRLKLRESTDYGKRQTRARLIRLGKP